MRHHIKILSDLRSAIRQPRVINWALGTSTVLQGCLMQLRFPWQVLTNHLSRAEGNWIAQMEIASA